MLSKPISRLHNSSRKQTGEKCLSGALRANRSNGARGCGCDPCSWLCGRYVIAPAMIPQTIYFKFIDSKSGTID